MKNVNKIIFFGLLVVLLVPTVTQAGLISWLVGANSQKFVYKPELSEQLREFRAKMDEFEFTERAREKNSKEEFFATLIVDDQKALSKVISPMKIQEWTSRKIKSFAVAHPIKLRSYRDKPSQHYIRLTDMNNLNAHLGNQLSKGPSSDITFDLSNFKPEKCISVEPIKAPVPFLVPPVVTGLCSAGVTAAAFKFAPSLINRLGFGSIAGEIGNKVAETVGQCVPMPTQNEALVASAVLVGVGGAWWMGCAMSAELKKAVKEAEEVRPRKVIEMVEDKPAMITHITKFFKDRTPNQ